MKLVLATRNIGKVTELTAMLNTNRKHQNIQLLSLQDFPDAPEVIEDGDTYQENAAKKASMIADYTGLRTLADDAGLEVDALGGAPGIHSKRWAGDDATDAIRIQKMLQAMKDADSRNARFVAAIAIAEPMPDNTEPDHNTLNQQRSYLTERVQVVVGTCDGYITHSPTGDSGFGYDPIFVPNGYTKTFAELGETIKNQISHRSEALRLALKLL